MPIEEIPITLQQYLADEVKYFVIVWPIKTTDEMQGRPSILKYNDGHMAMKFVENWKLSGEHITLAALVNGSTIRSANGDFTLGIRRGIDKEWVREWAIRNHPNLKLRVK